MSIATRAALAVVMLLGLQSISRADDRAEIEASGRAFAKALFNGDIPTAKKYAITNEQSDRMLDFLSRFMKAHQNFETAAVAKYGEEGKQILPGRMGPEQYAKMEQKMKDAKVELNGNTATVTPQDSQKPVIFRKQGGLWKVDLTDRTANMPSERNMSQMDAFIGAIDKTAGEIKDGKYQAATDARRGLMANLQAAMAAQGGGRPGGPPQQ